MIKERRRNISLVIIFCVPVIIEIVISLLWYSNLISTFLYQLLFLINMILMILFAIISTNYYFLTKYGSKYHRNHEVSGFIIAATVSLFFGIYLVLSILIDVIFNFIIYS
jgi:hypothetical protein